jgi:hypothetical protein
MQDACQFRIHRYSLSFHAMIKTRTEACSGTMHHLRAMPRKKATNHALAAHPVGATASARKVDFEGVNCAPGMGLAVLKEETRPAGLRAGLPASDTEGIEPTMWGSQARIC